MHIRYDATQLAASYKCTAVLYTTPFERSPMRASARTSPVSRCLRRLSRGSGLTPEIRRHADDRISKAIITTSNGCTVSAVRHHRRRIMATSAYRHHLDRPISSPAYRIRTRIRLLTDSEARLGLPRKRAASNSSRSGKHSKAASRYERLREKEQHIFAASIPSFRRQATTATARYAENTKSTSRAYAEHVR